MGKVRFCLEDYKQLKFIESIGDDDELLQCPECERYYLSNNNKLEKVEKEKIKKEKHYVKDVLSEIFYHCKKCIKNPNFRFGTFVVTLILVVLLGVTSLFTWASKEDKIAQQDEIASRKTMVDMKVAEKQANNKVMFEKNGQKIVFDTDIDIYNMLVQNTVVDITYNKFNRVVALKFPLLNENNKHIDGLKVISKDKKEYRVTFEKDNQQVIFKVNSFNMFDGFVEGSVYSIDLDDNNNIKQYELYVK